MDRMIDVRRLLEGHLEIPEHNEAYVDGQSISYVMTRPIQTALGDKPGIQFAGLAFECKTWEDAQQAARKVVSEVETVKADYLEQMEGMQHRVMEKLGEK